MSTKITKTEKIELIGKFRTLCAAVVNEELSITVTYPGDYRDSASSETISDLDTADVRALVDFLNTFLEGVNHAVPHHVLIPV